MAPSCYDVNKRRNLKRSGTTTAIFSLFIFLQNPQVPRPLQNALRKVNSKTLRPMNNKTN